MFKSTFNFKNITKKLYYCQQTILWGRRQHKGKWKFNYNCLIS